MLKRRILVLTPRFPYPPIGGDRLRILHVCRALREEFRLTLLTLCENRDQMDLNPEDHLFDSIIRIHLPRWRSYLNTLFAIPGSQPLQLAYYRSEEFRRAVDVLLPQHDLVVAHLIRTGQYLHASGVPRILEMTDAISLNYRRIGQARGQWNWKKLVYQLEQKRLERYEKNVIQRFERVWLTSAADRCFLDPQERCPIHVIPNGSETENLPFRSPEAPGHAIIFIGNMESVQNQDACLWFLSHVFPKVRNTIRATFRIVGNANPKTRRIFAQIEGVEMTGRIDRIEDGVHGGFCGVCPLRAAAGIQNKVLEYLALGLPCVTSSLGLGGVDARPGEEVLVYRDAEDAADKIILLQRDAALRLRLAHAGRSLVEHRYNWSHLYQNILQSALEVDRAGMPNRDPKGRDRGAAA